MKVPAHLKHEQPVTLKMGDDPTFPISDRLLPGTYEYEYVKISATKYNHMLEETRKLRQLLEMAITEANDLRHQSDKAIRGVKESQSQIRTIELELIRIKDQLAGERSKSEKLSFQLRKVEGEICPDDRMDVDYRDWLVQAQSIQHLKTDRRDLLISVIAICAVTCITTIMAFYNADEASKWRHQFIESSDKASEQFFDLVDLKREARQLRRENELLIEEANARTED